MSKTSVLLSIDQHGGHIKLSEELYSLPVSKISVLLSIDQHGGHIKLSEELCSLPVSKISVLLSIDQHGGPLRSLKNSVIYRCPRPESLCP